MDKKIHYLIFAIFFLGIMNVLWSQDYSNPIVSESLVFEEKDGLLAVEAEHFYKQSKTEKRKWYRYSANESNTDFTDADPPHLAGASNGSYLEILPDTRRNHGEKLIKGENFANEAGSMAILHYKAYFHNPGRYYVWARIYSTGTEDNGMHVGLDGNWPAHGQRMQWTAKRKWFWDCKQRTKDVHVGVPMEIYLDIDKAGEHEIMFSMREDGFEFDKFILVKDKSFRPKQAPGPEPQLYAGVLPPPFPEVREVDTENNASASKDVMPVKMVLDKIPGSKFLKALDFPLKGGFYKHKEWLAINPNKHTKAETSLAFPYNSATYDLIFLAVGENDGKSSYNVQVNGEVVGNFTVPLTHDQATFGEGWRYSDLWEAIEINKGDNITVASSIASKDGKEYSRGRWSGLLLVPITKGKDALEIMKNPSSIPGQASAVQMNNSHGVNGDGTVSISGEKKQWHKVSLELKGPYARELDHELNPFRDHRMTVTFTHESGNPTYEVPGYFAADGKAAETSATEGNVWKAHLSPDKAGKWYYEISFLRGEMVAVLDVPWSSDVQAYHGKKGSFEIAATDKKGKDLRSKGRLEYVGEHYLQFQGNGEYFLKAGADAPETLLAYQDFDNTVAKKAKVPLKSYTAHLQDWKEGDPSWKNGKGKGLIGAINYLAGMGVNTFSFLTYNAGGDGDNVWPFIERDDKYHYDCSKLDQWGMVFEHAQSLGMYLHFKTQETENDDNQRGKKFKGTRIVESLDGGDLGPQRRLYYRELIARYGHLLALNWNLGEENTQSTAQRMAMAAFIDSLSPYKHNIVLHTFPNQQDKVYPDLLGAKSQLTGASLQNEWKQVHKRTLQWVKSSAEAGKPWVVANDEQGSAGEGVPPDPGYKGYQADQISYDLHDIRKQVLWANFMAGGAGVEYYFGYKLPQNDLLAEDFKSREESWKYAAIALDFFRQKEIPFWEMENRNELIANAENEKEKYCFAKEGLYLIYLAYTSGTSLDLTGERGKFEVKWFNPREGGDWQKGRKKHVKGGKTVDVGRPPVKDNEDWVVLIKKYE